MVYFIVHLKMRPVFFKLRLCDIVNLSVFNFPSPKIRVILNPFRELCISAFIFVAVLVFFGMFFFASATMFI